MFGGGENYFKEPLSYDHGTLQRFCQFCSRLRTVQKPGKKAIHEASSLAKEVGNSLEQTELVIGALLRHIKTWVGLKQLACWYVLDKLCKENPSTYGFCTSKYVLDIARDYMPFEDPELREKYEVLVEHWENVFPRHVVDAIWMSKKERIWSASHPEEYQQQLKAEEDEWKQEELAMEDEDGLNAFGQPCMDYLQGRCGWGDRCTLYHPPGEEGSLPPECRLGDWKCRGCGVINRHYRRRCANCVREKPQYKRLRHRPVEDTMLSTPDPNAMAVLRQQFGYVPYDEEEAVQHWAKRFQHTPLHAFLAERKAAYRVRILKRPPSTPLETRCQVQKHFAEPQVLDSLPTTVGDHPPFKRLHTEMLVPPETSPDKAAGILVQLALERGVRDGSAPAIYAALSSAVRSVSEDESMSLSAGAADGLLSASTLAYTAWKSDSSMKFCSALLQSFRGIERKLGLSRLQSDQLFAMTNAV